MNNPHHPHMAYAQWPAMPPAAPIQPMAGYPAYPAAPTVGMAQGYPPGMALTPQPASTSLLSNPRFIRGALFGAVAAYLLTNENVQQAAIKSAVKMWSLVQGGVEEMKERFRDAEAELHAAQAQEDD